MSDPAPHEHAAPALVDAAIPPDVWRQVLVVMERLAASSDLDEVLGLIIDAMRDCLGADRASVFEYDRERHELVASRAHGVERSLRFSAGAGLAGEAVRTRRIVNVPDCYADSRFNPEIDRKTGYRTRCMLTVPLVSFDGQLEGVAQVLNRKEGTGNREQGTGGEKQGTGDREQATGGGDGERAGRAFDALDETIARALASQAAVGIRRARLLEAERRKNKIEADLRVAQDLQRAGLPRELPVVPGYDLAAANRQTEETGGDTYDLALVGEGEGATDGLLILMADATGHGVGPALSATQVQAMLRMGARLGAPLERLVATLNLLVAQTLPVGRFVTAFIGILEPGAHRVRYVSAGQAPIVVVRGEGGFEERDAGVPPLGVDPGLDGMAVETIDLAPGDALLLLSDGYYEHTDGERRRLSVAAIVEAACRGRAGAGSGDNGAQAMLEAVDIALAAFSAGQSPADDQTAVIVRRRE